MKVFPESDTLMLNSLFFDCKMFLDTFRCENSFICQKYMLWKGDEILSKSETVLREVAGNTGGKLNCHLFTNRQALHHLLEITK